MSQGQDFLPSNAPGDGNLTPSRQKQNQSERILFKAGLQLTEEGKYAEALLSYDRALEIKPDDYEALTEKGYVQSLLGEHQAALASCDRALKIQPNYDRAWAKRGYILRMLGRRKEALASCDRALEINPARSEAWSNRGVVLLLLGRKEEALANFEKALEIQPDYYKAWYNRGIVLAQLNRNEAALASFEKALEVKSDCREVWYPQAWYGRGFILVRLGLFDKAIASFEQCLEIKPDHAAAALKKLIVLIISGKIIIHVANKHKRIKLLREMRNIFNALKYNFILLGVTIFALNYFDGAWMTILKEAFSVLFSLAIVAMIIFELWKNRSNLSWVLKIYFRSGILAYVRAFCIVVITLTAFAVVTPVVPPFLQWGWAGAVFGNNSNIIFQPFDTIKKIRPSPSEDDIQSFNAIEVLYPPRELQPLEAVADVRTSRSAIDYSKILISLFWLFLVASVPFWARLEERIFRRGANTWKQIIINSIIFGLVHILVGIPIFAGFIIIIPGFFFACRYKYVRDRYWKKTKNEEMAQEAGVEASTADHAIYNAILITLVVAGMLLYT